MGSTKNVLPPYHAIIAQSMAADITSPVSNIQYLDNCMIQLNFTGTPTGTFDVQVSEDYRFQGDPSNTGNWVSLPLAPAPLASGSADQIVLDLNQLPGPWIRVVYSRTSGTGTLDMYITAKMI